VGKLLPRSRKLIYELEHWMVDVGRRELRAHGKPVPIGGRSFQILEALLQTANELVTKDALIDRVWPGAIVDENTLHVHISALRKAFGSARGMLKTESGRGYRLVGPWTVRSEYTPPPASGPMPLPVRTFQSNLPLASSTLIGRDAAIHHLRDLVHVCRVITLTGAGGIGKTRLGLEVARVVRAGFPGDAMLVELASLSDPNLVPSAVASVLGLELSGGEISPITVARAIGERQILLVLDNCEHLVDATAELTETIGRLCPRVTVLATSRELLRIDGERAYQVAALDVPAQDAPASEDLLKHSAVQLFVERTRALQSELPQRAADLSAIGAICRRLDGIPLAIEFAAARAATLGLESVLSHLDERFSLLTGGHRTALPQHQTLRAALDWSYELLPEVERRQLRCLAVFPAGFTPEAAIAVMGATDGSASSVLEQIANLVTKSLVVVDMSGVTPRWRLLETTRAYALEKLAESGDANQIARLHAMFFRDLVIPASGAQPAAENLARYAREIDNIRAALDWAFAPRGDAAIGVVLTAAYVPVWLYLLLMDECSERVERALDSLEPASILDARLRAQLHITLGFAVLNTAGLAEKTKSILTRGLELAEALGDVDLQLRATWAIWSLYFNIGKYHEARSAAERILQVANQTGDRDDILVGQRLLGSALHFLGRQPEAGYYLERVLDRQTTQTHRPDPMWFLVDQRIVARAMLARVLLLRGHIEQARYNAQLSLEDAQASEDKLSICYALRNAVCPVALTIGDLATGRASVALLSDLVTRQGMTFWISWGICLKGQLLIRCGEFAEGLDQLRAGIDMRARTGWLMRNPEFLGVLAEGLAAVGRGVEALTSIGEALSQSERDGQFWCMPELLRIKGEILLREAAPGSTSEAENYFARALETAANQGALLWALRASISMASLRVRQGQRDEAQEILAPVYGRFTEGFDTADLRSAKALLEKVARRIPFMHSSG
jgi:predicted ATPase/DNA-binding winged helix-turn-helix (wHTH) protein